MQKYMFKLLQNITPSLGTLPQNSSLIPQIILSSMALWKMLYNMPYINYNYASQQRNHTIHNSHIGVTKNLMCIHQCNMHSIQLNTVENNKLFNKLSIPRHAIYPLKIHQLATNLWHSSQPYTLLFNTFNNRSPPSQGYDSTWEKVLSPTPLRSHNTQQRQSQWHQLQKQFPLTTSHSPQSVPPKEVHPFTDP